MRATSLFTLVVLGALASGCSGARPPGEPLLNIGATPLFITTDGQAATLTMTATAPDGSPGSGTVSLDAIAGQIAGGGTVTLGGDGVALTKYQCYLASDPGCAARSVRIIATWTTGAQHAQATVNLTLVSPDGGR